MRIFDKCSNESGGPAFASEAAFLPSSAARAAAMAGFGCAGDKGGGSTSLSFDLFRLVPKNCLKPVGGCFTGGGPFVGPFFGLRCSGGTSSDFLRSLELGRGGDEDRFGGACSPGAASAARSSNAGIGSGSGTFAASSASCGRTSLTGSTGKGGGGIITVVGGSRDAADCSGTGEAFLTDRSGSGTVSGEDFLTTGTSFGSRGKSRSFRAEPNVETEPFWCIPFGGSV